MTNLIVAFRGPPDNYDDTPVRANNAIRPIDLVIGCDKKWLAREDYVATRHSFAIFMLQSARACPYIYKKTVEMKILYTYVTIFARRHGYVNAALNALVVYAPILH